MRKTSRTRGLLLCGQHRRDARTAQAFKDQRASVFTRAEIKQGTARAIQCTIYAQSLQANPPNPAVCHGTLRLPLRGDHGHVPRPHIDPISLYWVRQPNHGDDFLKCSPLHQMSSSSPPLNPSRTLTHQGPLEELCYHRQLNICTVIYNTILSQMSAMNGKSTVFTGIDFGMLSSTEGSLVRTKVGPLRTPAIGFVT